jgi:hypothetical protein
MRVEVDERERTVRPGCGAQLGEHNRVIAADAQGHDSGVVERFEVGRDAGERLLVIAGHRGGVAVVDQREVLGDVDVKDRVVGAE